MKEKKNLTMKEVKLRKKRLQDDLELLEKGFQSRVTRITSGIPASVAPLSYIRQKPFTSVGIALVAGLVAGLASGKKRGRKAESTAGGSDGGSAFSSILIGELKRIAARRSADYLSELLEQKFSDRKTGR